MMKYEIDVEGVPEGWKLTRLKLPASSTEQVNNNTISCRNLTGSLFDLEKIQPRRIVLELTEKEYDLMLKIPIEQRLFADPSMIGLLEKIRSVKENEVES